MEVVAATLVAAAGMLPQQAAVELGSAGWQVAVVAMPRREVAAGGLVGALAGLGVPEYEAKRFEGRLREGGILLSVHCDDGAWAGKAKDILKQSGAEHVAVSAEKEADYQP